tara:strand:- start:41619 stop:42986 length:1368 start_codon:yes stop_codon:yes gene_type:complete
LLEKRVYKNFTFPSPFHNKSIKNRNYYKIIYLKFLGVNLINDKNNILKISFLINKQLRYLINYFICFINMRISESDNKKILNEDELERYQRHISLNEIGINGQINLKHSSVIFIGAGGLGSSAILYSAAAGIGTIGIIDDDKVEKSNLQRQIIHDSSSVGEKKINSAKQKIEELNPNCKIITYEERLNPDNILEIFGKFDIICDCSDNFGTRYLVNDACILLNKPFVFGSVQGFEGQVSVFNLNNNSPNLRDLIPQSPSKNNIPSCKDFGIIGVSTGLIGVLQSNEIIKIIIQKGDVLDGKLLIFNLLNMTMKKLTLKANLFNNQKINNLLNQKNDYEQENCHSAKIQIEKINDIEFKKIYQHKFQDIIIIDVREKEEFEENSLEGSVSIPLSIIDKKQSLELIKNRFSEKQIYTICQKGVRSERASKILLEQNIKAISIEGGIEQLMVNLKIFD